jgi:hypothetical protein
MNKRVLIFVVCCLCSEFVFGITFNKHFHNSLLVNSAFEMPDGGVLVAGSGGPGSSPQPVLLRLTNSGNITWCFQYDLGQFYYGSFKKIIQGETRNSFYVIGERAKISNDESDPLLLKLNDKGSIIWKRTIAQPFSDYFYDVVRNRSGLTLVGETGSFGRHQTAAWIVRFSPQGVLRWSRAFDRGFIDNFRAIVPARDGYLLAGTTDIFTSDADGSKGLIIRINALGDYQWHKTYSGGKGGFVNILAAARTLHNDFVLVGSISRANAEPDALILKTDSSGNIRWKKALGGVGVEDALSVLPLSNGSIAVAGETTTSFPPGRDGFFTLLSSNGVSIFSRLFGENFDDDLQYVTSTNDGGFLLTGTLYTPLEPSASELNSVVIKANSLGVLDEKCNLLRNSTMPIKQASLSNVNRALEIFSISTDAVSFFSSTKPFHPVSQPFCN